MQQKDDQERSNSIPRLEQLYQECRQQNKYGLLKKLEEEAMKLAIQRDYTLRNEPNPELYFYKKSKKSQLQSTQIKLLKDKKEKENQIRTVLKEKKESLFEFVQKKRKIFMTKMNICIKKEETQRLEDLIKNEEEALQARELDINHDCELVKTFMKSVREQAEKAQLDAENEARTKENNTHQYNVLINDQERLNKQLERSNEDLEKLKHYQNFLLNLAKSVGFIPAQKKKQEQLSTYLTEAIDLNQDFKTEEQVKFDNPFDNPYQVIEILDQIEEKNLYYIQNTSEATAEADKQDLDLKEEEKKMQQKKEKNQEKLSQLIKQRDFELQKYQKCKNELNSLNDNKLSIGEGEEIEMNKIAEQIIELRKLIENKTLFKEVKQRLDQSQAHSLIKNSLIKQNIQQQQMQIVQKAMDQNALDVAQEAFVYIEREYFKLNMERKKIQDHDDNFEQFHKEVRNTFKYKRKLIEKLQKEILEEQDKIQRLKKKNEQYQKQSQGRKVMEKYFLEKGPKKVIKEEVTLKDDDEKFLRESFNIGSDITQKQKIQ